MPEDNESRLEQILSELPSVKRLLLEEHLKKLSGEDRDKFVKEVIKEYEILKSKGDEQDFLEAFSKLAETDTGNSEKDESAKEEKTEDKEPEKVSEKVPDEESSDLEKDIIEALKSQQTEKKEEKPSLPAVSDEKADDASREFTKDTIHKPRRSRAPAVIITLLALIVAGALSYVFILSKNPAFAAFTSQLGIPVPSASASETTTAAETTAETTALPTATPSPTPSPTPAPTEAPAPTEIPTPTPIALKSNAPNLKGIKVVIDPGHQLTPDYKKEPYKKGATTGKAKATSGAVGVVTGQKEYELTLDTALMLKEYLEKCGATVILTRSENDVNLSNKQRAAIAVKNKPTLFIRLHADALSNKTVKGVRVYIPSSGKLNKTANGNKLGKLVAKAAGTTFRGTKATNQYTGLNFAASVRSYQIVLGYLSNEQDDKRLADPDNRYEMCAAIATFCSTFKKK